MLPYPYPQFHVRTNICDYIAKINEIISSEKKLEKRILKLVKNGYCVRLCYVPNTKLLDSNYYPKLNEHRIVIGRPAEHLCKQVFCVILKN